MSKEKDKPTPVIIEIAAVLRIPVYFEPVVIEPPSTMIHRMMSKLTRREKQVLAALVQGQANKEIAALLNLSERTVKFHVSSLLAKFKVHGRVDLVNQYMKDFLPAGAFGDKESKTE